MISIRDLINSPQRLAFIGGGPGSGKSTTTQMLMDEFGAVPVRFHESFFRIAERHGLAPSNAFSSCLVTEREVWEDYVDRVGRNIFTVSDVHYAIQPTRDSAAALGLDARETLWPMETYAPSFNVGLIELLRAAGIDVLFVLLSTTPEESLRRVRHRDGEKVRIQSLEEMAYQIAAEERIFSELIEKVEGRGLRIDSCQHLPEDCVRLVASALHLLQS